MTPFEGTSTCIETARPLQLLEVLSSVCALDFLSSRSLTSLQTSGGPLTSSRITPDSLLPFVHPPPLSSEHTVTSVTLHVYVFFKTSGWSFWGLVCQMRRKQYHVMNAWPCNTSASTRESATWELGVCEKECPHAQPLPALLGNSRCPFPLLLEAARSCMALVEVRLAWRSWGWGQALLISQASSVHVHESKPTSFAMW